jgi:uncharacterized repeat protein (TIGR03803 family)
MRWCKGSDGYFYGTTQQGGPFGDRFGTFGTIFKMSPAGVRKDAGELYGGTEQSTRVPALDQPWWKAMMAISTAQPNSATSRHDLQNDA